MSEISAYHEAGHAWMAIYLGGQVRSVTIEPDWDNGPRRDGDVQIAWPVQAFNQRELCEREILVALAGPVAEMIHRGEPFHPGLVEEWANDWQQAWAAAEILHIDQRKRLTYLEGATRQLDQLLGQDVHWAALAAIVDHLLAHRTLTGDQVMEIVAPWYS